MADAVDSAAQIVVTGALDEPAAEELKMLLLAELEAKNTALTVDLSRLDAIPSGILSLLAAAAHELTDPSALSIHVSPRAYETLCEWRFDSVFALYEKTHNENWEVHQDGDTE